MEIYVTYNAEAQLKKLTELEKDEGISKSSSFYFIDSESKKGKKESWALKSYWGARLDPFAIIMEDDKPVKAFYSEAEDVIEGLRNYLQK